MTLTPFRLNTYEKPRGRGGRRISFAARHHMRHVMSLSPVPSGDCAYFPSSRGCTTPLAHPSAIFLSDLCASVAIPLLVSIREGFGVYAWDQLQGVLVVDLFQDLVGDLEAVDAPERVAAAVILEIFVACFQRAKIPFVF